MGSQQNPQVKGTPITGSIMGSSRGCRSLEHSTAEASKITLCLPFGAHCTAGLCKPTRHLRVLIQTVSKGGEIRTRESQPLGQACIGSSESQLCGQSKRSPSPWTEWEAMRSERPAYKTGKATCKRHLVTTSHRGLTHPKAVQATSRQEGGCKHR